jgi:DNA-binding FadR family transcriptional regulator
MTNSRSAHLQIIRPVRSSQNTEQVVARVYELIKRDELKPGDRLPPERELAKQLGISRPSLRAGLSSLISMGVLQSRQGAGTFIVDGPPALDSEPLRLLAELHGFSYDHMFETRSVLEVGAAGLAAERATGDHSQRCQKRLPRCSPHSKTRNSFWFMTSRSIELLPQHPATQPGNTG